MDRKYLDRPRTRRCRRARRRRPALRPWSRPGARSRLEPERERDGNGKKAPADDDARPQLAAAGRACRRARRVLEQPLDRRIEVGRSAHRPRYRNGPGLSSLERGIRSLDLRSPLRGIVRGTSPTTLRRTAATKGEGEQWALWARHGWASVPVVIAGALVVLAAASASPARAGDGSLLGCGHEPVNRSCSGSTLSPTSSLPGGDFESRRGGLEADRRCARRGRERAVLRHARARTRTHCSCRRAVPPPAPRCACSSCCRSCATSRPAATRSPTCGSRRSTPTPRGGSGRLDLPALAASRRRSWTPSLPAIQLLGTVNVLTLDGLTSQIALRFTPKGNALRQRHVAARRRLRRSLEERLS